MSYHTDYETVKTFLKEHVDENIDDKISGNDPADLIMHLKEIDKEDADTFVRGDRSVVNGDVLILENGYGFLSESNKETHFYKLTDEQMRLLKMNYI